MALYEDDVEISNPLGSYTKIHKICNVYWTVLNLPESLRSDLKSMALLGICKSMYVKKFGFNSLLSDFIEGVRELQSDLGMEISVDGEKIVLHGALVAICGDGLALNGLGGFKENFSWATRPCRNCNKTLDDMSKTFFEKNLRNQLEHNEQVRKLKNQNQTQAERNKLSAEFGVTGESVLCQIPYFDVTKMLLQDIMHNMYEGVAAVEARLLINDFVNTHQLISLEILNNRLLIFPYTQEQQKNKPAIDESHLIHKLRQNASQMMTILAVLPIVLAPFATGEGAKKLANFSLLCNISYNLSAFEIRRSSISMLKFLIRVHHERFAKLYPTFKPTPKFHFLVHAPKHHRASRADKKFLDYALCAMKHGIAGSSKLLSEQITL